MNQKSWCWIGVCLWGLVEVACGSSVESPLLLQADAAPVEASTVDDAEAAAIEMANTEADGMPDPSIEASEPVDASTEETSAEIEASLLDGSDELDAPDDVSSPSDVVLADMARSDASDGPTDRDGAIDSPAGEGGRRSSACGSRAWACWPMPNAPDPGLPNPASYTDSGNGTILDHVTTLEWQRDVTRNSKAYNWTNAAATCAGLSLDGGGWRLPTRIELLSIVDSSRTTPAIDIGTFLSTPPVYFWTASPSARSASPTEPAKAWFIDFYSGQTGTSVSSSWYTMRCVRGGPDEAPQSVSPHYEPTSPGEIRDSFTGLVWQQGDSNVAINATEAEAYCASLALNGDRWRLPSMKELATLVDEGAPAAATDAAIDLTAFARTTPAPYWSSTIFPAKGGAWSIDFRDGSSSYSAPSGLARCVR